MKGTGTIRRKRWDKITESWPLCEHRCVNHRTWAHRALPETPCHLPMFHLCPECLEMPTGYGRALMREPSMDAYNIECIGRDASSVKSSERNRRTQ